VYAGVQFEGGIHKSADGGATWTNINSRFLGPSLATFTSAGTPISSLVVGSGPQPPLMAASGSTAPCGFYKSLDGGLTFTQANGGLAPVNNAPLMYCGNFAGQHIAHSPAAPSDFFAGMSLRDVFRHTVDASALPPICSLSANPTTIAQGVSSTLTAYCSPAATSYVWSSSAGFSSNSAGGLVSPTQTTTYTVQGVNANGSSAVVGVTVYAPSPRPVNVATRGQVLKGENVLIAGFAIDGPTAKTVVVRGRGPSLVAQGIAGSMGNPTLRLASSQTNNLRTNDDWGSAPNAAEVQASGFAPSHPQESAIMMTLNPGLYTAVMSGSGGSTGVGIVEVFEVDHPEVLLVNISTRGLVETGDNVMIAGFVVNGSSPLQVVVRARGPSLSQFGILNPLANPALNVFSGQTMIGSNDNWQTAPNAAQVQSLGYAPSDANESAILISLSPGAYTAVMSGVGNTTGVGIVEVFAVP
jgi:hypothetical protein